MKAKTKDRTSRVGGASGGHGSEGRPAGRVRRVDAERHSLAAILNLLRARSAYTRQEIEQLSGLGRAIVADRLSTLARLSLSGEGVRGRPTGGRAPRLVQFRADAGVILVSVLSQTSIGIGVADLTGKLLIEHHEAADLSQGPAPALKRLETLFEWVLEQHHGQRQVWGVGIAVPGPVEVAPDRRFDNVTKLHFLPNWDDYPLTESLTLRYQAPVSVRNGVQMRALGELRAGIGDGVANLLFVDLGKEISGGLISGGRLHGGAQGAAGLIGHVSVADGSGLVCRCGNTGCLELIAGSDAIVGEATRGARNGQSRQLADVLNTTGNIAIADIGLAALRGDAFSAELLSRCGRHIGSVLAELANAINPSLIVLGGEIAETGDILLAAIREAIYRRSHPLVTRDLKIVRSHMGSSASLAGAALAVIDDLFAAEFLCDWVSTGSPRKHPEIAAAVARAEAAGRARSEAPRPPVENALSGGVEVNGSHAPAR